MNAKVSVIIPVYNVEKYLRECVDSVINQTYKNLEIILVDDGSPDNCPKICDEYAEKDSRIKVIHKENGWLSSARNAGMDIMTGDYVTFIDSDDFVKENMIERMVELMEKNDADVVQMEYCSDEDEFKKNDTPFFEKIIEKEDNIKAFFEREILEMAWGKLYRSKVIDKFRFCESLRCEEDTEFGFRFYQSVNRTVLSNEKMYFYFIDNPNSIMKNLKNVYLRYDTRHNIYLSGEEREKEFKWLSELFYVGEIKNLMHYYEAALERNDSETCLAIRKKIIKRGGLKILTFKFPYKIRYLILLFCKNGEKYAKIKGLKSKILKRR